jgi:hypothetical protein
MVTAQIQRELANSHLNPVARKIWAEALAQPEFAKVQVIWAWGNGPDHNNGRCCDFMITIPGVPRAEQVRIGDAIRAYFVKHAKRLHVTGVIWNRHVSGFPSQGTHYRGPEGQARPYSGPSTHTDHNHVEVSGKVPTHWLGVEPAQPAKPSNGLPDTKVAYVDKLNPGQTDSDSVRWLQHVLGLKVTGTYDAATVEAVKAKQAAWGDDVIDGDLGPLGAAKVFEDTGVAVEASSK